ncbi:MAG TPA: sigma-70 family RNA polymerase sigma factor [Verrucomicrobiae bacterium]|nr:sigma-70 family RNA polymerase sigma factor [Verrucomicrobiae bacterium]
MSAAGVTGLLIEWGNGDRGALDRLMPLVYEELRRIARRHLHLEGHGHTLQSTALVHEAYLRLVDQNRVQWRDRAHFFAVSARLIRRILLDHARRRLARKRGGAATRLTVENVGLPAPQNVDLIALDQALDNLAELDATQAQVVEMRFFAGLTIPETAEALRISTATVERDWITAKAWLFDRLNSVDRPAPAAG